jgi:hypothetical protein
MNISVQILLIILFFCVMAILAFSAATVVSLG